MRTLRADWTTKDKAIGDLMTKLMGGAPQLPLLAIFPGSQPNRPIVLKTFYTRAQVIEKLEQAGPSANTPVKHSDSKTVDASAGQVPRVATRLP